MTPGGIWAYLAEHAETSQVFNEAMAGKAHGEIAAILAAYDFSTFTTIADIGGGRGHLLRAILGVNPTQTGVLFDQPRVLEDAPAAARAILQPGDFFQDPLPVCDAY